MELTGDRDRFYAQVNQYILDGSRICGVDSMLWMEVVSLKGPDGVNETLGYVYDEADLQDLSDPSLGHTFF